jgi:two-component system response regulator NreC
MSHPEGGNDLSLVRILIVDDHGVLRAGLKAMISAQPDMDVVGLAADGEDALRQASALRPDVVILDIELPGTSGLDVARRLRESCPATRILVLTMHDEPALVREAFEAGASGFVVKEALGDDLLAAVRTVHQGRSYINVSLLEPPGNAPGKGVPIELPNGSRLSEREHQVLEMLAQGFTNAEIGQKLFLSPRTIGTYRGRINEKLGLRTRADIVQYALDTGILTRA